MIFMMIFIGILIAIAAGLTLFSLLGGLFAFARGHEADHRRSNKFMRMRVVSQFVAVVLFVIAMLVAKSS